MNPRHRALLIGGGCVVVVALVALWGASDGTEAPPAPATPVTPVTPVAPVTPVTPVAPGPPALETRLEAALAGEEQPLAEVARELAGADGVVCGVEPRVLGGTARLELDEPGGWLAVAAVRSDVLVLSEIPEAGSGMLRVEGFAPAPIRWSGARGGQGRCEPDPLSLQPAEAGVLGTVVGCQRCSAALGLTACGQPVSLDDDGGFYAAAVPGEICVVEARRHYGVWAWSDTVEVVPQVGDDAMVEIEVPGFEAVLPLIVAGGRIEAVWEGDEQLVGARILAVDGAPVPDDPDGFHLATGGAAGSEVQLELERDGRRSTVPLVRRALGFEDWLVR
ncbi:MAG TPA: hypothetical protein ENK18_11135 [Deltaproteobacteria bacterium]|nr:hypothetical protein [Deltaproteobacteria bacterium]